jgi:hypothetical protein
MARFEAAERALYRGPLSSLLGGIDTPGSEAAHCQDETEQAEAVAIAAVFSSRRSWVCISSFSRNGARTTSRLHRSTSAGMAA